MFIPEKIQQVLRQTVQFTLENEQDVPESDRMHTLSEYSELESWASEFDTAPELDTSLSVESHCTHAEPGDLFRPVAPGDEENTADWKRFIGGEMTPNDTWYYAMAYADPNTGLFDGIHFAHDSQTIELVTLCGICDENQAEYDTEVTVEGTPIPGPACEQCCEEHSTPL